ncbi:MAG: hypothetical protein ACK55Z_08255, partial [bacterium]
MRPALSPTGTRLGAIAVFGALQAATSPTRRASDHRTLYISSPFKVRELRRWRVWQMAVAAPPLRGEVLRFVGNKECAIERSTCRCAIKEPTPEGAFKTNRGSLPRNADIANVEAFRLAPPLYLALSNAECGREARG